MYLKCFSNAISFGQRIRKCVSSSKSNAANNADRFTAKVKKMKKSQIRNEE
uniref:Uncharacterized protein n=1 Tax=Rhizophora mucronata TaxID=61149 RepID=A0A2P2PK70_RHIMU